MKDNFNRFTDASSEKDGIVFYSNRIPGMGVISTVLPDGSIRAEPIPAVVKDFLEAINGDGPLKDYHVNKQTVIIIDSLLIIAAIISTKFWWIWGAFYFAFATSQDFIQSVVLIATLKLGKSKQLARFHAAEHMSLNAYQSLGRVPTLEEIKKYSRFSKYCGSRKMIETNFFYSLIILIFIIFESNSFIPLIILGVLMLILKLTHTPVFKVLGFLQILVTNKPTDLELNVAIEGLKELEKFEDDFAEMMENARKQLEEDGFNLESEIPALCIEIYAK